MTTVTPALQEQLTRWQRRSLIAGAAALVIGIAGAFVDPLQFLRAYLVAYLFFLGIAHGCLVALMIYHLTGGAWGYLIRRTLETGVRTLPLLAILFLPIALGVHELYVWAQPKIADATKSIQHKQIYLNVPFFWVRALLYFVLWIAVAELLLYWSRKQDETENTDVAITLAGKLAFLSGPGLAIFGITITFASVDWVMSLQPAFRSTIFGPLFASGEILTGFAWALIVFAWLLPRTPLAEVASPDVLNDLGNLLFTFLIIWAYLTFFQFMLIWIANLPYDVIWYLPRTRDGWEWVVLTLIALHFAVPFFLLLLRDIKRHPPALAGVAALVLVMHLIYMYYQVLPAFAPAGISEHWLDFLTPIGIGGVWLAFFLWHLKRTALVPRHDLNREAAVRYRALDRQGPEVHHA